MTTYELMVECPAQRVRLEVPVRGLREAMRLFQRVDDLADGVARAVRREVGHAHVADLTNQRARGLLDGIDDVWLGQPGRPERGPRVATADALQALPDDASLEAMYVEV